MSAGSTAARASEHRIFDADAHVTEPRDLFTSRLSRRWGDLVPQVRYDAATEEEAWFIAGAKVAPAWGNAAVGWENRWPPYPKMQSDAVPASYDAKARLAWLDRNGIVVQVLYPNVAGFGGQRFLRLGEPELMLACVRAYNDFLIEWTSVAPERFVPVAALPFWDIDAAVVEMERAASIGHQGILFSGAPHELGFPYLADRHWDPIWSAAQEAGLPVSFHLGSGDIRKSLDRVGTESRAGIVCRVSTELFLGLAMQLNDLLFSGVLARFPALRFVLVESGIGALPFVLESADYHFARSQLRREWPWFDLQPSEYFRRQVYGTFWFEQVAPERLLDVIGIPNVLFETDYPHTTALDGVAVATAVEGIERIVGPDDTRRIVHDNAAALYGRRLAPIRPAWQMAGRPIAG